MICYIFDEFCVLIANKYYLHGTLSLLTSYMLSFFIFFSFYVSSLLLTCYLVRRVLVMIFVHASVFYFAPVLHSQTCAAHYVVHALVIFIFNISFSVSYVLPDTTCASHDFNVRALSQMKLPCPPSSTLKPST